MYGIVSGAGGFIAVDSAVGRGSEFRLHFPVADGAAPEVTERDPEEPLRGGRERVLLVEDDAAVRLSTAWLLGELGYDVLEAALPSRALEIAEHEGATVDLLLSDVVMPEMNGRELAELIGPHLPNAKVLFMSGYSNDPVLTQGVRDRAIALLTKPFTRRSLGRAVREALDGERSRDSRPAER